MSRAEALWLKIIGILLILLGLVLFASRAVALLTIAAGIGALILASRNRQ